ncbi:response regulator [Pedobacter nutrimenti]|uniref:Response regulator receiver domain-containing protein n=1 Tax=Pedobacter nutrimenti TaxID=1241337 RepID=A0A318UK52_9SPHI|nr:response regulator [Pedobacter nutrimenti]PYF75737.1 response regulator receiver domain-containing protein [Pedobacter nutrimenti]
MGDQKKILIVDDDNRNIFALRAVLKARGYDCLSAAGAEEGLEILAANGEIGVVLMDMMMPGMDGYQAIAKMKQNPELRHLPVIAVTAQAMMGDRERCLDAGAVGYVSKPINVEILTELLSQHIK